MTKEASQLIAARSKTWITQALIELLEHQSFESIRITDIITQADLTRQTFYRHFKSKEEVIEAYISELYQQLFTQIDALTKPTFHEILQAYFAYWLQQRPFLERMMQSGYPYDPIRCATPYVQKILNGLPLTHHEGDRHKAYVESFVAGGLATMKNLWMHQGFQETPEELAQTVAQLLSLPDHTSSD